MKYFKHYISFKGRINRTEYWVTLGLIYTLIFCTLSLIFIGGEQPIIFFIFAVPISMLPQKVKRLHDINLSAWWLLASCIPILGFFFNIYLSLQLGDAEANKYGDVPKAIKKNFGIIFLMLIGVIGEVLLILFTFFTSFISNNV